MHDVDRITATIRREYPGLVASGAFKGLFLYYPAGTDIVPTPDGPPVAVDVPAQSYVFRDDQTILTAQEFCAVCDLLTPATASEPQAEEEESATITEEAPQPLPSEKRPQTYNSGVMTPAEKARARARAQANRHG